VTDYVTIQLNPVAEAAASIRATMAKYRFDEGEYYRGIRLGLSLALIHLLKPPSTNPPNTCPECYATLPNDGSCCDACGWVRP
jgi:hypothetical protein